jgi:hypothetical protein
VDVSSLLESIYLHAETQEGMANLGHPLANTRLVEFFAGPGKAQETCSVARFAAFLGKASSIGQALKAYLPDDATAAAILN